ncbi:copper chaperone PCu(A)C [Pseudorhodobacter sp. E13]|uniref:copper chaperone PCu(A)C n=1 Tax=Pseudorhodobacter sp. E13 TaxID=2487931 RepID=UPI000F8DDA6B|nr:copper chaperone PCu(A)C [Pseudorhodobacter sp. E13]RUS65066.1 copper chaperone PCu(A)C [Pseudorhodobacter sp. E13]
MTTKSLLLAATAAVFTLASAPFAFAGDITIKDPYLRVSGAMAKTAAAFMTIENAGAEDRLIDAHSDLSEKVELHTHKQNADGVMQMLHVEEGFAIPAGGSHALERGADHVMFLGLNSVPAEGDKITLVLTFEKAGEVTVEVPVDNTRAPAAGGMEHGKMDHGKMNHGAAPSN